MKTSDDLDDRLARLRAEWPVGSMVTDVMARIGPACASPRPAAGAAVRGAGGVGTDRGHGAGMADRRQPADDALGGRARRAQTCGIRTSGDFFLG